jgi:AcrR family transcriptional regulator
MSATPVRRGPYEKGSIRREEIIQVAVKQFGIYGYHATSMREIATHCGLSQAGLLHYFPSKEALLLELVRMRDEAQDEIADDSSLSLDQLFLKLFKMNQKDMDVTRLWANLATEATYPNHPAHEYFVRRYEKLSKTLSKSLAEQNGRDVPNQEDRVRSLLFIAVWDGIQQQQLLAEHSSELEMSFQKAIDILIRGK